MFTNGMSVEEMHRLIEEKGGIIHLAHELSKEDLELYIETAKVQYGYKELDFIDIGKVGANGFYIASALQKKRSEEI